MFCFGSSCLRFRLLASAVASRRVSFAFSDLFEIDRKKKRKEKEMERKDGGIPSEPVLWKEFFSQRF